MPTKVKLEYLAPAVSDMEEIVKFYIRCSVLRPGDLCTMERPLEASDFPDGSDKPRSTPGRTGIRKAGADQYYVAIYIIIDNTVYIYRVSMEPTYPGFESNLSQIPYQKFYRIKRSSSTALILIPF